MAGALAVVAILQGCGSREEVLLGAGLTGAAAGVAGAAGAANNEDDGGAAGVSAKPSVIEFVLVDVGTGLDLRVLNGGERIDVTSEPVTIRAVVDPLPGSVVFKVDGKSVHTDDSPPWTITDSDPVTGALTPWTPDSGKIQIEAEPHIESDGKGNRGTELEQTFVIE